MATVKEKAKRSRRSLIAPTDASEEYKPVKAGKFRNRKRRAAYQSDPAYRKTAILRAKETYYRGREIPESPLAEGLLANPLYVEVLDEDSSVVTIEGYSIPRMSQALGKDSLTLKRWIKAGMIPDAIYIDTVHGYRHYEVEEVEAIAEGLVAHFEEYQYFREDHKETAAAIAKRVARVRGEA